ncbi:tRNA (guanosine(46)-N7)-methyltransferase TrmB [Zooshikella ganghwensis]|uniref:tRNA (guanosine(46)-N7)-methyltransferase TrmB n=1 Tax=Zooshikella ganghwensis TaxID=202772 RepID=UPI0003FAA449|nr:tRNA (guanosine(46)-N7)-methyltransferase TrmB [Zooshikella ganghwensis]
MTEDSVPGKKHRVIKSFVIRAGRMTVGQQRGWDEVWPKMGLDYTPDQIDLTQLFGREAPTIVEIGFGMGHSLLEMAKQSPENNFIGIEVHRPGVGALLNEADKQGLTNLRVFCHDAVEVLSHCIPESSLSRVQLYFPDPWHKKRHHKRRLVQPAFAELVRSRLVLEGVFHMATDWENYAEHMAAVLENANGFKNTATEYYPYIERPAFRPLTKFEKRGHRLGHGVWDMIYQRSE